MLGRTKKRMGAGLTLALAFTAGSSFVPPAAAEDVRAVFDQILQDPENVDVNLRYARLTIAQGELRKALAAYERVLAKHPDNPAAKAGIARVRQLLKPNFTEINAVTGGKFESNPSRFSSRDTVRHDGVFFGRVALLDERRAGARRWRTGADIFANVHVNTRSLDYGVVAVDTGPLFPLGTRWQVHTFVGGAYAYLDGRTFQSTGGAGITFEPVAPGLLRGITVKGEYDFVGDSFSKRDGYVIDVSARFIKVGLLTSRGIGTFTPYYRYNGVSGKGAPGVGPEGGLYPLISHQVGGRADYFLNLKYNITLNANVTVEYQHFFEQVLFENKNRRDLLVAPGAQVILAGLLKSRADLIFSYRFEYNSSNDGYERYTNHIAGVRVLWRIR